MSDDRFYIVKNGFQGNGWVGVLLEARDEEEAVVRAAAILRSRDEQRALEHQYGPEYWADLTAHPIELPYVGEFG